MKIPLCKPCIDGQEIKAVEEVLKSGWLAHGPKNKEFCDKFAKYIGTKHAIACNSCTSALFLCLIANDIKGEVLVPSFTFVASANVIEAAGAIPIFVDIDPHTNNIDVKDLEKKITPKTQAIIPVHFAGLPCNMDSIMEIAKRHNLIVIEDSAETIGASFNGKKTGSFGIGCFSFFPTKNITTGEGGMITTNNDEVALKIKALLGHGIESSTFSREKEKRPWLRAATFAGYNFRMSDILACIGSVQIDKIEFMNKKRIEHSNYLIENLKYIEGLELPFTPNNRTHVFQMFTIKVNENKRDSLIHKLREKGIGASVHFDPPVHKQPYYLEKYPNITLPVTEDISKRIITLPMYPSLSKEELNYIIQTVREILR